MKRPAAVIVSIAAALAASAAFAIDRAVGVQGRVITDEGAVHEGKVTFKKDAFEIETGKGTVKVPAKRVQALDEVDPFKPRPEADVKKDELDHENRAKDVKEGDAIAWVKLATWARKRGLDALAKQDLEKAIAIDPEQKDARQGLLQVKDGDAWKDAREVVRARRQAAGNDDAKVLEVAKYAQKVGLDDEVIETLRPIALRDAFHKGMLAILKPAAARRRPRTELRFPLKGRWRVSPDPTHHHEIKAYALFAVDLNVESEDGKLVRGEGRKAEDCLSWGEPIYAAADGVVEQIMEGYPDNPILGKIPLDAPNKHNGVSITHESGELTWYLHTMKGSITVKAGDKVKQGDVIGKVGNSGASGMPHLHFTLVERGISIPWHMGGYRLVIPDGPKLDVKRGRPTEGQLLEAD